MQHTVWVKEITHEFHLGWAQWIVGRKCESSGEHTTFKAGALRTADTSTQ